MASALLGILGPFALSFLANYVKNRADDDKIKVLFYQFVEALGEADLVPAKYVASQQSQIDRINALIAADKKAGKS